MAHQDYLALTACGDTKPTTLVTRDQSRVRCQDCLDAIESGQAAAIAHDNDNRFDDHGVSGYEL